MKESDDQASFHYSEYRGTIEDVAPDEFHHSSTTNTSSGLIDSNEKKNHSLIRRVFTFVTKGGTAFDAFLLAASQEVGQVILTLPWVFSLVGMKSGIVLQIFFATAALYTNYLLVNLHTEFRKRLKADATDPRSIDPHYVVSYHDIMGGLIGPFWRYFSFTVVFLSLFGLSTVQIIATGSNMYIFHDELPKRTWALISGGLFSLLAFVPNFRHYRLFVILANIATTYTSWYMTITSAREGPVADVVYDAPQDAADWFRGMVGLLFCFGGHASNIEVAASSPDWEPTLGFAAQIIVMAVFLRMFFLITTAAEIVQEEEDSKKESAKCCMTVPGNKPYMCELIPKDWCDKFSVRKQTGMLPCSLEQNQCKEPSASSGCGPTKECDNMDALQKVFNEVHSLVFKKKERCCYTLSRTHIFEKPICDYFKARDCQGFHILVGNGFAPCKLEGDTCHMPDEDSQDRCEHPFSCEKEDGYWQNVELETKLAIVAKVGQY